MDSKGIRRLYLPLRPKVKYSPGRKTPPSVSAPSTGLRPLNVSCVKCGGRTLSGVRKPPPESSVPGDNLNRGSRRNQLRRGHGSPPVLSEVLTSLAFRCALQRVQTVPAAIHSGRIPPPRQPIHGDRRLSQPPHHTGHGPFRTRPPNLS